MYVANGEANISVAFLGEEGEYNGNTAGGDGGAIYAEKTSPLTFGEVNADYNSSSGRGGAIAAFGAVKFSEYAKKII